MELSIDYSKNRKIKSATVYDEITNFVDKQTGEVISQSTKSVVRRKDVTEFTMVFIDGLSRLTDSDLTKGQAKVLFEAMKYSVNNTNMLYINKSTKELIAQATGLRYGTVENCITELVKKEIILRVKRAYLLNPLIFGRGGLENVKKLTQSLEIEYDFEKGTAVEKMTTKSLYKEVDNINLQNTEIIESNKKISNNGNNVEEELVVQEKEDVTKDYELVTLNKKQNIEDENNLNTENRILELELQNSKNKASELELENKKLDYEIMKMKLAK